MKKSTEKSEFCIWFCFVKINCVDVARCIKTSEICLAQSLGFYFCWMGYAKWAELGGGW